MRLTSKAVSFSALLVLACVVAARSAYAQSYGVDLRNTLMPASGGMAGTSVAAPQDLLSAMNANPAALTQFGGTQFVIGGAWAEPTFNLMQSGDIGLPGDPLITPFSAKSQTPGAVVPNLGVAQELSAYGLPITLGLGLIGAAGGGTSFRDQTESNGTSNYLTILEFAVSAGILMTDRLSIGATVFVGDGYLDGPFVGNSAMTNAYAVRGSVGLAYALTDATSFGMYYQTVERFEFEDAIRLELLDGTFDISRDINLGLPQNVGFGLANSRLLDGRLLLAADVLFIDWNSAALFRDIYRQQWVVQLGSQLSVNRRLRIRMGYAYAENPIDAAVGTSVAGIDAPGGVPAIKYLQAQFAVVNQHRFSAGVGLSDVLPGVDLDGFAGGMFPATDQLGSSTTVDVESYWIGLGLTWHFRRGEPCFPN